MTKHILSIIILFGLLSCTNSSTKNEENDDSLSVQIVPLDYLEVDTVALLSDEFEYTHDNKFPVSIIYPGEKVKLVGELGLKMGEVATVCGIITEGPDKGYGGGPNLIVQKINGVSIQRFIQIPVSLHPHMWPLEEPIPKLENEATYCFRVYETGEFQGTPNKVLEEAGRTWQTCGFYFQNRLIIISLKKINKIIWAPTDFLGRKALIEGKAKTEKGFPIITGSKWKIRLINASPFTESEIGKLVEVYGKVQKTEGQYSCYVEDGRTRLVKLEDQLGKKVKLRGIAGNINEYWWLNYRGTNLYVENMDKLMSGTAGMSWSPIEITGILEQAKIPRIDQINDEKPELEMCYIVRNASWRPVDELLAPEVDVANEN